MALMAVGSNRLSELIEAGRDTKLFGEGVDAEFVVAASKVLDEGCGPDRQISVSASGRRNRARSGQQRRAGRQAVSALGEQRNRIRR